ncbi:MAG: ribosome-binding factor A [Planctomycetota bacterium]|jgi:ribosome-binding factor A
MANERTIARLESRIKERAAHAIEFELNDPRSSFITITKVDLASDLASVKIFYSVLGNEAEKRTTARMLTGASGFIQRQVGSVLRTRHTPRITFFYDDSIEKIDRMDELLNQAFEKDREVNPGAHEGWEPKLPEPGETDASSSIVDGDDSSTDDTVSRADEVVVPSEETVAPTEEHNSEDHGDRE